VTRTNNPRGPKHLLLGLKRRVHFYIAESKQPISPSESAPMNTQRQSLHPPLATAATESLLPTAPPVSWRQAVPVLTGEHCALRELQQEDARGLLAMLAAPEVARFISPPPSTVERFAWFIDWSRREREGGRYLAFALVPHAHSSPVGLLQLRQLEPEFRTAEWGVAIASEYWGAGLFLDAARLLLDFAFTELGVHRLEARAALANGRGQAAMRKLGAVQEGVLRRSLATADGQRLDQVLWSVLADEWPRLSAGPDVLVH
jgi:RimJ/RimL family protein N-acetyltransferase